MGKIDVLKQFTSQPAIVKLAILFLIWTLVHLPGVTNFYYSLDDAITYVDASPSDLKINIDTLFPMGRFLLPFYFYFFSLLGIDSTVSNTQTWLMGIYTCWTGLLLMRCLEKDYGMRNSIAIVIPSLYIVVSPLFVEAQYLRVGVHYPLAMLLSALGYTAFSQKKLALSVIFNLSALMLSQVSGMVFYVLLLLGAIAELVRSDRSVQSLMKQLKLNLVVIFTPLVIYAALFIFSRQFYQNQNESRGMIDAFSLSFFTGKLELMWKISQRFITAGFYSSTLISLCIAGILVASIVLLYIQVSQKSSSDRRFKLILLTVCLMLLLPVACLPLIVVSENWPSFRVSTVAATACIVLCVLPLGWLNRYNLYSKAVGIFLLFYICLISFYTLDIGTQKIIIFQKDMATVSRIKELNDDRGIDSARVVYGEVRKSDPYNIPNMVLSETDLLLQSSLEPSWSLKSFLRISQVGTLVDVSDSDRQKLVKEYCRPDIKQMTPVMSTDGITVLCR